MTTKFGVEIECVGWNGSTYDATVALRQAGFNIFDEVVNSRVARPHWKVVQEASVWNGVEIISPPLPNTPDGLSHFGSMLRAIHIAGGTMDSRCGMHVHLDASFLNHLVPRARVNFFQYLIERYAEAEHIFDHFVKPTRRGTLNRYCKTMRGKTANNVYYDREHKLNISSYDIHRTIEFRHYHGTLNDEAAKAWVTLCSKFLNNAIKMFNAQHNNLIPIPEAA